MNPWDIFTYLAIPSVFLWIVGGVLALKYKNRVPLLVYGSGVVLFSIMLVLFWVFIERVPMQTMGETRLLYSLFLPMVGLFIYKNWKFSWIPLYTGMLATVFVVLNILKPEIHNSILPPVLQSVWFVPHVVSYMISYAVMGVATILAIYSLFSKSVNKKKHLTQVNDKLVGIGLGLITIGLFLGSFWAKEAWGDYWSWDPKETWAAITWLSYISYLHIRRIYTSKYRLSAMILIISFVFLQITWYGMSWLPSAASSVHSY